jgi:hypothetical protein
VKHLRPASGNGLVLGFVREIGDQLKTEHSNLLFATLATLPKPPIAAQRKAWLEARKHWENSRLKTARRLANAW